MLIFSEKMRNIPEVVLCLKHALEGKALYGLVWNPRSVCTGARVSGAGGASRQAQVLVAGRRKGNVSAACHSCSGRLRPAPAGSGGLFGL